MPRLNRYFAAAHRVQSAIAVLMAKDPAYSATDPKHMRTGIDLQKSDMKGLAELLIAKGIFTSEEYIEAVTKAAEEEADSFEKMVQTIIGNRNIRTR